MGTSGPGGVSGSGAAWAGGAVRVLSIDLGTSNTVAVLSAHGRPPRVVDVDGASTMPSAVFAADGGRLVVGREALRLARTAPARFEPNPKRRVDEGNLLLGDAVVPVAAALAAVLGKVVAEAGRQLGGSMPDQVRLTHPARWGTARRAVLLDAARQAGIGADLHNGVVAMTENHSSWEYGFRDTTEVRLMGVDQDAVTVMVVTPGPAALYTVSGPNEMAEAPELDPEVAGELVGAERSYRVGGYLVCGFRSLSNDHPVVGVVRMVE